MGPIFGQIGQFFLDIFGPYGQIIEFCCDSYAPVDSLKCVDFKNVQLFCSSPILSGFNWLRSQKVYALQQYYITQTCVYAHVILKGCGLSKILHYLQVFSMHFSPFGHKLDQNWHPQAILLNMAQL